METLVLTARSEKNGSAVLHVTIGVLELWGIGKSEEDDGFSKTSVLCNAQVFRGPYHHSITPVLHYSLTH
jgi:hypothetical protein